MKDSQTARRLAIALLTAFAVLVPLAAWAGPDGSTTDGSSVSLTINSYLGIDAGNINTWSKGLDDFGVPKIGTDGTDPTWSGGTENDMWPGDGSAAFCTGAVGRSVLSVRSNGPCTVQLKEAPNYANVWPMLKDGHGHELRGHVQLGWAQPTQILPAGTRTWFPLLPGLDASTWVYTMVERKGLQDVYGTYTSSVVLEAYTR